MSAINRGLRVFAGNVPWSVASTELRQFASKFGPVVSSHVVFDKNTGLNKGYGFVSFATPEAYEAALKSSPANNQLDGNNIAFHPHIS